MRAESRFEPWPWGVGAALLLGLSGPLAFLWIAVRQPPERVPLDRWGGALAEDAQLRGRAAGAAAGWDVALRGERDGQDLRVVLEPTSAGAPLPPELELRLLRERPERLDLDQEVALERDGPRWVGRVTLPAPGRWRLVARAGTPSAWVERSFVLETPR